MRICTDIPIVPTYVRHGQQHLVSCANLKRFTSPMLAYTNQSQEQGHQKFSFLYTFWYRLFTSPMPHANAILCFNVQYISETSPQFICRIAVHIIAAPTLTLTSLEKLIGRLIDFPFSESSGISLLDQPAALPAARAGRSTDYRLRLRN